MFQNRPFGGLSLANLRANGTKISTIRIATASSSTMNLVIWWPKTFPSGISMPNGNSNASASLTCCTSFVGSISIVWGSGLEGG